MKVRGPAHFRQSDLTRALRAARAAGLEVIRFEIDAAGGITIVTGEEMPIAQADRDWLAWRARYRSPELSAIERWRLEQTMKNAPGRSDYEKWKLKQKSDAAGKAWRAKRAGEKVSVK